MQHQSLSTQPRPPRQATGPLHKLVYVSEPTRPMRPGDLNSILDVARERNEHNGITGLLRYYAATADTPEHFVQVLEGALATLETLRQDILTDSRHTVRRHEITEIAARQYPEWSMGFQGGFDYNPALQSVERARIW